MSHRVCYVLLDRRVKILCTWAVIIFLRFNKIWKKKSHVANNLSHKRAGKHAQILCTLGYKRLDLSMYIFEPINFVIFV
jgi:hypothetical protein